MRTRIILTGFFLALICLFQTKDVLAQDDSYTPPPMFEDTTPALPPASESNPAPATAKIPLMKPIIEKTDIEREKAVSTKPAQPKKPESVKTPVPPKKPESKVKAVDTPKVPDVKKPKVTAPKIEAPADLTAPIVVPPKAVTAPAKPDAVMPVSKDQSKNTPGKTDTESKPKSAPAKRDPSVSAIQGPQTMPALPAGPVDQEKTFDAKKSATVDAEPTILERSQRKEVKADNPVKPMPKAPNPNVKPATFEPGELNVLKKSIPYEPGQIALNEGDLSAIAAGVNKQLDTEKKWRVEIRSYATPYGNGLSSDRRIALSRALSLRTSLISQGVSASRINVLAEGLQTDSSKSGDRIDIYLYGPKE